MHQHTTAIKIGVWVGMLVLAGRVGIEPALADITPARDGTHTQVRQSGNRIDITGGSRSRNGRNLFHSFEQFGLDAHEIANFRSRPGIHNILGRVVGGDASVINGLIRVSGGNSNLYLMNPAGVIFGRSARLDIPRSFTVTTANRIRLGHQWFNAVGSNPYAALVADPNGFAFTTNQPGAIANFGVLSVSEGNMLNLFGGSVLNAGRLSAPGGQIAIVAVPGENMLRLSQDGMILQLEIPNTTGLNAEHSANELPFNPLSLPELLTVGVVADPSIVATDQAIQFPNSGITVPTTPGMAIASGMLDTSCTRCATTGIGGGIDVLGDRVALIDARVNASGTNGGGRIRVGGDYQEQGTVFNAARTLISSGSVIRADALQSGNGGRVIVWADEATGFYGEILARGGRENGNGGFVEVSGKQDLIFRGDVDVSALHGGVGTLLLDPTNIIIVNGNGGANDGELNDSAILTGDSPGATFTISETALENLAANVDITLEATNSITINDLADNELDLPTISGSIISFVTGGAFTMNPSDTISTQGGQLTIIGNSLSLGGINMPLGAGLFLRGNEIDFLGGDASILVADTPPNTCCVIALSPLSNSQTPVILGGTTDTANTLDLTQSDLSAFSPASTAVFIIGSPTNLTIPGNPDDPALTFNRNLSLVAGATLSIERPLEVTGPISLQASEINLLAGSNSLRAVGSNSFSGIRLFPNGNQGIVVGGLPGSDLPGVLDLTEEDLAALQPDTDSITIGRLEDRPALQIGDITVLPGAGALPLNEGIRVVTFETNQGTVRIQREVFVEGLTITAADVELEAPVTATVTVLFQPADPASTIGIGDGAPGAFNLNTTELTTNLNAANVAIGSPGFTGTGTINLLNLDLSQENYNLTIRGGDIVFGNTNPLNFASILRMADNTSVQLISTGTIFEGANIDVELGNNGAALFDAANGIQPDGSSGGLDFVVRNNGTGTFAARVRNSGNINFSSGGDLIVGSVGGVDGISVLRDGSIDFSGRTLIINQPVTVGGSGDIQFGSGGMTLNSPIQSGGGNITLISGGDRPGSGINFRPITIGSGGGEITTTDGNIVLTGGVAGNQPLILNAGTGNIEINPIVDNDLGLPPPINTVSLSSLTVNTSGNFALNHPVAVAGDVSITAADVDWNALLDVSTGNVSVTASGNFDSTGQTMIAPGGNVAITGANVTVGDINTTSNTGNGGAIALTATNDLTINGIITDGGDLRLSSGEDMTALGNISTGGGRLRLFSGGGFTLSNASIDTGGGEFIFSTPDAIRLNGIGAIATNGGDMTLRGTTITIARAIALDTSSTSSQGGAISLTATDGGVFTGNLNSSGTTGGGRIAIAAQTNISTGDLNSSGTQGSFATGTGGDITLRATEGRVNTGDLDSSGRRGGSVDVQAEIAITTGNINTSGAIGNGGDVTLDPRRDIEVGFINAQGGNDGRGGTVDITSDRLFRATNQFSDRNGRVVSISTAGGLGGGAITIRHGGGQDTAFNIGNLDQNGTTATITSGEFSIYPIRSFDRSVIRGNIQILTSDPTPTPSPSLTPSPRPDDQNPINPLFNPPIDEPPNDPISEFPIELDLTSGITDFTSTEIAITSDYIRYLGLPSDEVQVKTLSQAQRELSEVEARTGGTIKPAIIYAFFVPAEGLPNEADPTTTGAATRQLESSILWQLSNQGISVDPDLERQIAALANQPEREDDYLQLVLVTATEQPIVIPIANATRKQVEDEVDRLRDAIASRRPIYSTPSQQLYAWLIAPLEPALQQAEINTIAFVLDTHLRSIPLAALQNSRHHFLIETYNIGLMPSLSLTDIDYHGVQGSQVLAMGASDFETLTPLPAAPLEVQTIATDLWQGQFFLNADFTTNRLRFEQQNNPFGIIHLATHADFQGGNLENSYIQFSDRPLRFNDLRQLDLQSSVELLVLSACQTALGDVNAELGFAGLAVQAGVKSALASLWSVDDAGTLALMTEFYRQLNQEEAPIKAAALRRAQLAMRRGEVRIESGELRSETGSPIPIAEVFGNQTITFEHPFYWSAFTIIGSPW
jgi:filamentous hemagglutinin family protein